MEKLRKTIPIPSFSLLSSNQSKLTRSPIARFLPAQGSRKKGQRGHESWRHPPIPPIHFCWKTPTLPCPGEVLTAPPGWCAGPSTSPWAQAPGSQPRALSGLEDRVSVPRPANGLFHYACSPCFCCMQLTASGVEVGGNSLRKKTNP